MAGGISIDGGGTADVIALGIENLKAGQRVYEIAVGGCLLISFLRNGLTLLGVVAQIQLVAVGLIIVIAVTSDRLAVRKN